ncbi:MAG: hypothetical protein ACOC3W_08165 [Thermodesulfobacteriota bacterium]
MTHRWIAALAVFVLVVLPAVHTFAASLQEDYQSFEAERQSLEETRRGYESRMTALASQVKSLNMIFFQCVSPKQPDYWEEKIAEAKRIRDDLEAERKELSKIRKSVNAEGRRLEQRRQEIEETHTRKGPGTPYETDFREYMAALSNEYFEPLETRLFAGYDAYLSGVEQYVAFLKESVGPCMKRDRN